MVVVAIKCRIIQIYLVVFFYRESLYLQKHFHLGQVSTLLSPMLPEIQGWGNPCLISRHILWLNICVSVVHIPSAPAPPRSLLRTWLEPQNRLLKVSQLSYLTEYFARKIKRAFRSRQENTPKSHASRTRPPISTEAQGRLRYRSRNSLPKSR